MHSLSQFTVLNATTLISEKMSNHTRHKEICHYADNDSDNDIIADHVMSMNPQLTEYNSQKYNNTMPTFNN